jgi:peptidoglycan/LPS O-acetylase OafA/YrhL
VIFDLIRVVAAFAVLVDHAMGIFPLWPALGWLKQYGVVVFFLLSGFLISRTLHRRLDDPNSTFVDYAIDRWSRIYSGFLPAIILVCAIDYIATSGSSGVFRETVERYTVPLFFANLFMLQAPTVAMTFGSASPFWTVAIEFWIYMFVGLIAFARRDGLTLSSAVAIVLTGIIPVQSLTENYMILVPWLLGAGAERLLLLAAGIPRKLLAAAGAGALAYLTWRTWHHLPVYSLSSYVAAAIAFTGIVAAAERIQSGAAVAAWFASWSYSLYLLHHSVLLLVAWAIGANLRSFGMVASVLIAILIAASTFIIAIAFATLTEVHHKRLASSIKKILLERRAPWNAPVRE